MLLNKALGLEMFSSSDSSELFRFFPLPVSFTEVEGSQWLTGDGGEGHTKAQKASGS